jgi:hypothetical protein
MGTWLPQLETLVLRRNQIVKIDDDVALEAMKNLRVLSLEHNRLTSIPSSLEMMPSLRVLTLSRNQLDGWNLAEAAFEPSIEELYISENKLSRTPASIYRMANLRVLDLSQNELTKLGKGFANLAELVELRAKYNRIGGVPKDLSRCSKLRVLDLSFNRIAKTPPSVAELHELIELRFDNNSLFDISPGTARDWFQGMKKLQIFTLDMNPNLSSECMTVWAANPSRQFLAVRAGLDLSPSPAVAPTAELVVPMINIAVDSMDSSSPREGDGSDSGRDSARRSRAASVLPMPELMEMKRQARRNIRSTEISLPDHASGSHTLRMRKKKGPSAVSSAIGSGVMDLFMSDSSTNLATVSMPASFNSSGDLKLELSGPVQSDSKKGSRAARKAVSSFIESAEAGKFDEDELDALLMLLRKSDTALGHLVDGPAMTLAVKVAIDNLPKVVQAHDYEKAHLSFLRLLKHIGRSRGNLLALVPRAQEFLSRSLGSQLSHKCRKNALHILQLLSESGFLGTEFCMAVLEDSVTNGYQPSVQPAKKSLQWTALIADFCIVRPEDEVSSQRQKTRQKEQLYAVSIMNNVLMNTQALADRMRIRSAAADAGLFAALEAARSASEGAVVMPASALYREVLSFSEEMENDREEDMLSSGNLSARLAPNSAEGRGAGGKRRRRSRSRPGEEMVASSSEDLDSDASEVSDNEEEDDTDMSITVRLVTVGTDCHKSGLAQTSSSTFKLQYSPDATAAALLMDCFNERPEFRNSKYSWGLAYRSSLPSSSSVSSLSGVGSSDGAESTSGSMSDLVFLEPESKPISDLLPPGMAAQGKIVLELRLKLWMIKTTSTSDADESLKFTKMLRFDPHASCAEALSHVRSRIPHDSAWEKHDWGLFWVRAKDGSAEYLEDTAPLAQYIGLFENFTTDVIELRLRPVALNVRLFDSDTSKLFHYSAYATIGSIIESIYKSVVAKGDPLSNYGLYLFENSKPLLTFRDGSTGPNIVTMAPAKQLLSYEIDACDVVRFTLIKRPVMVLVYNELPGADESSKYATLRRRGKNEKSSAGINFFNRTLDLMQPGMHVATEICAELNQMKAASIRMSEYSFYFKHPHENRVSPAVLDKPMYFESIENYGRLFFLKTSVFEKLFANSEELAQVLFSDAPGAAAGGGAASESTAGSGAAEGHDDVLAAVIGPEELENFVPPDIVFEDATGEAVRSGTLRKLIFYAISSEKLHISYTQTLLMTHHAFSDSKTFYRLIQKVYMVADHRRKMRILYILKSWVENYFEDFYDSLLEELLKFLKTELENPEGATYQSQIQKILTQISTQSSELRNLAKRSGIMPEVRAPHVGKGEKLTLMKIDEVEFARQLTLVTDELWSAVRPMEFYGQGWARKDADIRSPNLLAFIDKFNVVSTGVASLIVLEASVRERSALLERLIRVAHELKQMNNFHMLQAFISGFNNASVGRLKWTRKGIGKRAAATLAELEALMGMESSFKKYRDVLGAVPMDVPCVPYAGVHLQDLIFIDEGNPAMDEHRINFRRHSQTCAVVLRLMRYQKVYHNYKRCDEIQKFISDLPQLKDKEMFDKSLEIEPRNAGRVR